MELKIIINYRKLSQNLVFYTYKNQLKNLMAIYEDGEFLYSTINVNRKIITYNYHFINSFDILPFKKKLSLIADNNYEMEIKFSDEKLVLIY